MEVKELRVGNWVLSSKKEFVQVHLGTLHTIGDENKSISSTDINHHPIPLTEDILLKSGGKEIQIFGGVGFDISREKNGSSILIFNSGSVFLRQEDKLNGIQCIALHEEDAAYPVHRFQNLYFALTGEELDIKF